MLIVIAVIISTKFGLNWISSFVDLVSMDYLFSQVHHFTLYDSTARGFVRPFCLAYVTPDYR